MSQTSPTTRRAFLGACAAAAAGTLAGCSDEPEATAENHAEIVNGMTPEEVLEILGEPESRGGGAIDAGRVDESVQTWSWHDGRTRLTVTFKGGKVAGKTP